MMPDLPNVGWERDIEAFREFFESPAFRADGLKLYPTLVIRGEAGVLCAGHAITAMQQPPCSNCYTVTC